jgi:aerobic-type carbon monoxide dehydrogenase small subunit (CoxS/CutS family)
VTTQLSLTVDGRPVEVDDDGSSLLDVLRDGLGIRSPKDGCSPQGQCGCCTVLVDGQPRVSCVTPARRVAGRSITTVDGLDDDVRAAWGDAFCATGGSQCGFCTPGIVLRLEGLRTKGVAGDDDAVVEKALQAHLCRCTGWRTIVEAYEWFGSAGGSPARDLDAAATRARLEGGDVQMVGAEVALGRGGFADDTAPPDALVAVRDADGDWVVGETLADARQRAGKVQGRRTTVESRPPIELPPGEWVRTVQTSWVEPAYLETDASWCAPGGEPVTPLANGGAFGGKVHSLVTEAARELATAHGRPVRVLLSREDTVRLGPQRPPLAAGIAADGTIVAHVARTPGLDDLRLEGVELVPVDVVGPPTSLDLRSAVRAELEALRRSVGDDVSPVVTDAGASASATVGPGGAIVVTVSCGAPLDEVVLRSYCIGAAHMAIGLVTSEGLSVAADGTIGDLTIRSFGVLRAIDTPPVTVAIAPDDGPPVNGSDAVFAAVAAAVWRHQGFPPTWPTGIALRV